MVVVADPNNTDRQNTDRHITTIREALLPPDGRATDRDWTRWARTLGPARRSVDAVERELADLRAENERLGDIAEEWAVKSGSLAAAQVRSNEIRRVAVEIGAEIAVERMLDAERRLREATAGRDRMRALLEEIQWNGYSWIGMYPCVCCGGEQPKHASDCELAAALSAVSERKPA